MKLKRYVTISPGKQTFGSYQDVSTDNFNWYVGNGKIGLEGKGTTESNDFIGGFLVMDDWLVIDNAFYASIIFRDGPSHGNLTQEPLGVKLMLEKLLLGGSDVHVFTSALSKRGDYIDVLTFSNERPNGMLYREVAPMPVFHKDESYYKDIYKRFSEMKYPSETAVSK